MAKTDSKKLEYTFSSKLKTHRSEAQTLLENNIYLEKTSYFQRLKFNIELFKMEATTTSYSNIRKAVIMAMIAPAALVIHIHLIMEFFYNVFVDDFVKEKIYKVRSTGKLITRHLPLNLPKDDNITYGPY